MLVRSRSKELSFSKKKIRDALLLGFLVAKSNCLHLGTPTVVASSVLPAEWKLSKVFWVRICPMLWAQTIPTASPGATNDVTWWISMRRFNSGIFSGYILIWRSCHSIFFRCVLTIELAVSSGKSLFGSSLKSIEEISSSVRDRCGIVFFSQEIPRQIKFYLKTHL